MTSDRAPQAVEISAQAIVQHSKEEASGWTGVATAALDALTPDLLRRLLAELENNND